MWPERVPLPHHQTRLDVDLLDDRVVDHAVRWNRASPDRFRWTGSNASIQAVPCGVSADFVQVGVVAVAGPDRGDRLVGGVVDHVLALAEADLEDAPLPPGQDGLALVLLDLEVGRRLAGAAAGETTPGCRSVRRSSAPASPRPGRARGTGRRALAPGPSPGVVIVHRRGRERRAPRGSAGRRWSCRGCWGTPSG